MKYILLLIPVVVCSCWNYDRTRYLYPQQKVWGSKPVYGSKSEVQKISYDPNKHPNQNPGNIYAYGKYIFQIDFGLGIHVIDNSSPTHADRVGFIRLNGCQQISIRGQYLYTNSYKDLVTLDISDPANIRELSRTPDAFPDFYAEPPEPGYYTCPQGDSVVVGWVKDSIYFSCYKN